MHMLDFVKTSQPEGGKRPPLLVTSVCRRTEEKGVGVERGPQKNEGKKSVEAFVGHPIVFKELKNGETRSRRGLRGEVTFVKRRRILEGFKNVAKPSRLTKV